MGNRRRKKAAPAKKKPATAKDQLRKAVLTLQGQFKGIVQAALKEAKGRLDVADKALAVAQSEYDAAAAEYAEVKQEAETLLIGEKKPEPKPPAKAPAARKAVSARKTGGNSKKKSTKTNAKKKGANARKGGLTLTETIIRIMGAKVMGARDIAAALEERGEAPPSNNLPAYMSSIFSGARGGKDAPNEVDDKGKTVKDKNGNPVKAKIFVTVDRGRFKVADWVRKGTKSPKERKETAPETVKETTPTEVKTAPEQTVTPSEPEAPEAQTSEPETTTTEEPVVASSEPIDVGSTPADDMFSELGMDPKDLGIPSS